MYIKLLCYLVAAIFAIPSNVEGTSCGVVPIQLWGFSPSLIVQELPRPVDLVVVTHTVTSECNTDQACEVVARAIRNFHQQQGSTDIRLSFLVGGNGKIYEGAGWRVGDHTAGYSGRSISLSFIGDFREKLPTAAALEAAERFLGCFINIKYLECEYNLVGHRQLQSTISPGDALQNLIQTWPHWTHDIWDAGINTSDVLQENASD